MNTAALSTAIVGLIGGLSALAYAWAAHLKASNATKALQDHLNTDHQQGAK